MNVLIVYAHPNPASFNHAILDTVADELRAKGHEIRIRDLYAEGFDPVLRADELNPQHGDLESADVQGEQELLTWAEALVLIYPLWWFDRPAILKGWFDRVFTNGFAFSYTQAGHQGLLRIKKARVIVTAGGTQEDFARMGAQDEILTSVTDGTLFFCGIGDIEDKVLFGVPMASEDERQAMLEEVRRMARDI